VRIGRVDRGGYRSEIAGRETGVKDPRFFIHPCRRQPRTGRAEQKKPQAQRPAWDGTVQGARADLKLFRMIRAHLTPPRGTLRGRTSNAAAYVAFFVAESERAHRVSGLGATRPIWAPRRDPNRFYINRLRRLTCIHSASRADRAVAVPLLVVMVARRTSTPSIVSSTGARLTTSSSARSRPS
jgi:hypothetical protein